MKHIVILILLMSKVTFSQFGSEIKRFVTYKGEDIITHLEAFLADSNIIENREEFKLIKDVNVEGVNTTLNTPSGSRSISLSFVDADSCFSRYSEKTFNSLGYKLIPDPLSKYGTPSFKYCNCKKKIEITLKQGEYPVDDEWRIVIKKTVHEHKNKYFQNKCKCLD